jgi:hypothetical protein
MAKLYRFIFRFDFEGGYTLADRPGTVQRLLREAGSSFWDIVGATNQTQQVAGTRQRDQRPTRTLHNITIETTSISGQLEAEEGIGLEELYDDEFMRVCDQACLSIMSEFDLTKMKRVGARLFLSGGEGGSKDEAEKYCQYVKNITVPKAIFDEITVSDVAVHLIGKMDNDVQYRLVTGPSADDDRKKFLSQITLKDEDIFPSVFKYSVDLDLFQENINFKGTHLLRWLKAKQTHIDRMLAVAQSSSERRL